VHGRYLGPALAGLIESEQRPFILPFSELVVIAFEIGIEQQMARGRPLADIA
jgi:hypothetical protein